MWLSWKWEGVGGGKWELSADFIHSRVKLRTSHHGGRTGGGRFHQYAGWGPFLRHSRCFQRQRKAFLKFN